MTDYRVGLSGDVASRAPDRCLRVLTVTNRWPTRGRHGGVFVKQLVDPLRRLGHSVDVELIAQGRPKLDYALAMRRIARAVDRVHYDLIHVHYGLSAISTWLATDVPRVVSLYGSDVNVGWQRLLTAVGTRGFAARIFVSRRLATRAGEPNGIVIPNGVDFGLFTPSDRARARAALGITGNQPVVLFGASPARPVKGWDVFCDVVEDLKARGLPAVPMVLTEPGQSTSQVVQKLDAADVLLFTSRRGSEGSPTVVKEAVVMGLPVVSVDVGDVAEVLAGVEPSAVVAFPSSRDASAARQALIHALAEQVERVLAERRRANGREACRWLDVEAVAARVTTMYRSVLVG